MPPIALRRKGLRFNLRAVLHCTSEERADFPDFFLVIPVSVGRTRTWPVIALVPGNLRSEDETDKLVSPALRQVAR